MNRSHIHFPPKHEALRDDVHALGALIGEILREQGGPQLLELVEQYRVAAIRARDGDERAAADLAVSAQGRPPALARDLVRAFSTWFHVVNLAEKVHRIRRRRDYFVKDSQRPQPGGVEDALAALKTQGLTLEDVLTLIGSLRIEPVFAAHATDFTRRTLLRKQQRIAGLLLRRLDPTQTPQEARATWSSIRMELTTAWQTEELPRERLTVSHEREQTLFFLLEVLYRVLPDFYDEIAQALGKLYGVAPESIELPNILALGTWVGGDMDGHPDVHAKAIKETLERQQRVLLGRYSEELQGLHEILSQSAGRVRVSPPLTQRIEEYTALLPGARDQTSTRHDRMPYRVFLSQVIERLKHTYERRANAYEGPDQLQDDLKLIAASLKANKGSNAGLFHVNRLLRRISTFGFHLAALDVRQHARVLHQVVGLGFEDPQWLDRPRAERRRLLAEALEKDSGPRTELDALGKRTLAVLEATGQARHRFGPAAIGCFIVSGVKDADDVLAALLLARWASVYDKRTGEVALDIAPQFESIEALERCGTIMRELLVDPLYLRHLAAHGCRQMVVVGYSDSNKQVGICASRCAIHQAQQALSEVLTSAGERQVIFHARGGSLARGGGRIDAPVKAAPAGAVNGILRVREQGETVKHGYGLRPIAMRTLERAFNALSLTTAAAQRGQLPPDSAAHLACVTTLAQASREAYSRLVWHESDFYEYFRSVTPIDVIERMQIGSRPIHRCDDEGLEALMPVPWVFAWSQTRHMLPGWYGAGSGLRAVVDKHGIDSLHEMYAGWFFFRNLIDDVETMLARADLEIAQHYNVLAELSLWRFFDAIRAEHVLTCKQILAIKNSHELLDTDPTLQRSIRLRNPYIDPMNLMQIDLLQRWRASGREDRDLFEALLASTTGISQGLQSTG